MIFTKASLLLVVGLANNFNSVNGAVIPGGLLPDDLQDATDVVTDTTFTTISGKSLGRDDKDHHPEEDASPHRGLRAKNLVPVCRTNPPRNPWSFHTIYLNENAADQQIANGRDILRGACDDLCDALCNDGNACTIDYDAAIGCEQGGCYALSNRPSVNCEITGGDSCQMVDGCDAITGCSYVPCYKSFEDNASSRQQ